MPSSPRFPVVAAAALLAACQPQGEKAEQPAADAKASDERGGSGPLAASQASDTLRFTGTEPFWGGSVSGDSLTYTTPENPAGVTVPVSRFPGDQGVGFSGSIGGKRFDLAVTEEQCSDGMSDRSYPYTVKLALGEELRRGCAWSERKPFSGPQAP